MKSHRSVICLLLGVVIRWIQATDDSSILTSSGPIQGFQQAFQGRTVNTFYGIPYAEPPIGPLRFRRPQPVSPWKEVLHAVNKPDQCAQDVQHFHDVPWVDPDHDTSEDCLYLNLWAPSGGEEKKAVMFFIHGGGFFCGASQIDVYDGKALAAVGDVIVVTVNYRLGVLGFLYLDSENCPGNQGLYDQNLALKWVHNNIAAFGGDPDRITVFGESAGSISTGYHLMSPLSRTLFRRAIMESCTPKLRGFGYNIEESLKFAKELAHRVGCKQSEPHAIIQCLQNSHVWDLLKVEGKLRESYNLITLAALPTYGEEFIPKDPVGVLQLEDIKQTELLIGFNSFEGGNLLPWCNPTLFDWNAPYISFEEGVANLTKQDFKCCDFQKAKGQYLENCRDEDIRVALGHAVGDYTTVCPSVFFTEQFSNLGGTAYFYVFSHRSPESKWPKWMDVPHFDEIPFVFGVPLRSPLVYPEEDVKVSKEMIQIWTTFAKTGTPPAVGKAVWPKYTANRPVAFEISSNGAVEILGPRIPQCNFWRCDIARSNFEDCDTHCDSRAFQK